MAAGRFFNFYAAILAKAHRTSVWEDDEQPAWPTWVNHGTRIEVPYGRPDFRTDLVLDWHLIVKLKSKVTEKGLSGQVGEGLGRWVRRIDGG